MLTLTVRITTNKINIIQLTNFPSEGKIEEKAKAEDIEKRNGPIWVKNRSKKVRKRTGKTDEENGEIEIERALKMTKIKFDPVIKLK